ncbi:hypothetical protein KC850_01955 [Candidatus Kaiserbacteria bacterium]|nr:hypothetical protein [Candidatus Kaiserbacteria bacterium]MCB9817950.1 hypothetical protein [Candidatus Nomurabacteria bacterium]
MKTLTNNLTKFLPSICVLFVLLLVPDFAFAMDGFQQVMWGVVSTVFGSIAGWAGKLLNLGINDFVIGFGTMYTTGGVGAAVDLAWVSVRDMFNITFIFGLVYIGFKMILNSDDSNTRRWLINLIMAAILVNFSLYFTKFVVDMSNIIATEVALSGFNTDPKVTDRSEVLVSDTFADAIGLVSLFGNGDTVSVNGQSQKITDVVADKGAWSYIFGTMMFLIVAAFVFAAGGILLIIRAVVLCIYMVLSPLMFIGWVFPQLQRYTSEYWSGFLGRAFFAPLYILLLYLSASILNGYRNGLDDDPQLSALLTSGGDGVDLTFASSMTPFILAAVFLVASIVIANKLGANGAGAAISTGKNLSGKLRRGVTRTAGGATAGVAAYGGRKFIGGTANRIAENAAIQRLARRGGMAGIVGRAVANTAHYGRTASFDARNVGGLGKATGLGEGKKGGYANDQKEQEKKDKERSERYSTQEDDQFYKDAGEGVEQIKNQYDQIIKNINQTVSDLSKETNPARRQALYQQLRDQEAAKTTIEKDTSTQDAKEFNYVRKNNKKMRLNTYAETVERRGEDFGGWRKFLTDQQANTRSAGAIRKEKSDVQKLVDFLQDKDKGGGNSKDEE